MSEFEKRFTLRMPAKLFEEIRAVAETNHRPAAREIVVAIEDYVKKHKQEEQRQ